jgi:TonB family protein
MAADTFVTRDEPKNRRISVLVSTLVHILLILLVILPLLTFPDPPPGPVGVDVMLGMPDAGQGEGPAGPESPEEPLPEPVRENPPPQKEERQEKPRETKSEPVREKKVRTTDNEDDRAIQRQKEEERREKERQDKLAAAEAKRVADEKKAAEAAEAKRQADLRDLKARMSGGLGGGSNKTSGQEGNPDGKPDATKLEGNTGAGGGGKVGGAISDRGVVRNPEVTGKFQDKGTVVVRVCLDASGNVTTAEVTQRGTTTQSASLRDAAVSNARKWKFGAGEENQCGTITYNFILQ